MDILYVGTYCSERLISEMLSLEIGNPNLAAQKYHRLLAQGMALSPELFDLNVVSAPMYKKNINGGIFIKTPCEIENNVKYSYISIILLPIIKYFYVAISLSFNIIRWKLSRPNQKCYLLFDILNLNISIVTIIMSKLCNIKSISIVTDMPEFIYVLKNKMGNKDKFMYKLQNYILKKTNGYVVLTEAINHSINKTGKPYCIIEGLADTNSNSINKFELRNNSDKVIHYSGGLYEKFGVKSLIDAFMLINDNNIRLHLFGNGDLVDYITECSKKDTRIRFFGYVDNKKVIIDQSESFLLVNPRFTNEEYTKYSFPSKTIEYMASGVPLLTTKLPGIPPEYFNYTFTFEEETIEGYQFTLERLLEIPKSVMIEFGIKAQSYILKNKNNKLQAAKLHKTFSK